MQYFSAIKGKKILIHTTAWIHVNTLTGRSQIQKNIYYVILIQQSRKGKIIRENRSEVARF